LPDSDYDVLAVCDVRSRERRREPLQVGGPPVDLILSNKEGVRIGQLLSPEMHVMLKYGVRVGEWSWLDNSIPLSWTGADDTVEEIAALVEAAELNMPENPASVCRLGVEAMRKTVSLGNAIGVWQEAPSWGTIVRRYGLNWELIVAIRVRGLSKQDSAVLLRWAESTLEAARRALDEARVAVAGYPRNASDIEVERLLVAASV
jgi:hypothetical protein